MRNLYIFDGAHNCLLDLQTHTAKEAQTAIGWQRQGGFDGPFSACTYDTATGDFVDTKTGERFKPVNGGFTAKAWAEFLAALPTQGAE